MKYEHNDFDVPKKKIPQEDNILVSVIIPVYNVVRYLERCLDSVIHQTLSNIEIICVDDGSTDGSGEILDRYAKLDSRIVVIHKENGGASSARNVAISHVKGAYVYFVDSDDWIEPDTLSECVLQMAEDIDVVVVGSQVEDEGGFVSDDPERMDNLAKYCTPRLAGKLAVDDGLISKTTVMICDKLFRYEIIRNNGLKFMDGCKYEDIPFVIEYLLHSRNCYFINKYFYHYSQRGGSITYSKFEYKDYFRSFDYLYNRLLQYNLLSRHKKITSIRYLDCVSLTYKRISFLERADVKKLATKFAQNYETKYFIGKAAEWLEYIKKEKYALVPVYDQDVLIILQTAAENVTDTCTTIKSLLRQSYKVPKILVHVNSGGRITEEILSNELKLFGNRVLFVKDGEKINLEQKLKEFSNHIILTVESGLAYPKNWLFCVMAAYLEHKDAFALFQADSIGKLDYELLFRDFALLEANQDGKVTVYKSKNLIVSMTSYPARIHSAALSLTTIYSQSKLPDKVILWLGETKFPNKFNDLPKELLQLVTEKHLQIEWCDDTDLKSHTKYFYAFQKYPDALIVTVDDDIFYPCELLENLYLSYLLNPHAVSAACAYLISILKTGEILPYKYWPKQVDAYIGRASMQWLALGVGGVLYPTRLFLQVRDFMDKDTIKNVCLYNDDLWLKAMELAAEIPVVVSGKFQGLTCTPGSQEIGLWQDNGVCDNRTDRELLQIQEEFDRRYGNGSFCQKLINPIIGDHLVGENVFYELIEYYRKQSVSVKKQYEKYSTLRMVIRNRGNMGCDAIVQLVAPKPLAVRKPQWLPNGITIESVAERMTVDVQCKGNGELQIGLLGKDARNADGVRYPVWIDCTYFSVNGEVIFANTKTVCLEQRYVYKKPVADGEVVRLEVAWSECRSSNMLEEYRKLQTELKKLNTKINQLQKEKTKLKNEKVLHCKQIDEMKKKDKRLTRELNNVKTGWSYRFGRVITYIPRKIRDWL